MVSILRVMREEALFHLPFEPVLISALLLAHLTVPSESLKSFLRLVSILSFLNACGGLDRTYGFDLVADGLCASCFCARHFGRYCVA